MNFNTLLFLLFTLFASAKCQMRRQALNQVYPGEKPRLISFFG